jgi:hypothetical protein
MLRNAAGGIFWAGLFAIGACEPGPIEPRRGAETGDAGGGAGGEVVVVRDGGSATSRDVGKAGDASAPGPVIVDAGGLEPPELPPPDAARGARQDAAADAVAPREDAASRDAGSDAPAARAPRAGELVIDEVLVNPAGDDLGREWIEVSNLGLDWLDLSQLHLANMSVDLAVAGARLAPGGLRLFGQSADPAKNGGAPVAVAYGTKLILNNADGQVSLCLGACASGLALDTVSWGTLGDGYTGHALVVDPATKAICAASTAFGTAGSFGTPGAPNPPCGGNADAASGPDSAPP